MLPFLLIVLQFLAKPLYNLGLLPDFVAVRLGLARKASTGDKDEEKSCSGSSCCAASTPSTNQVASNNTNGGENDTDGEEVITIESEEEYRTILSKYDTVFIKFTAEWCKPCKVVHPFYATQLAKRYGGTKKKFIIIDVDEFDDVAGAFSVSVLPCFAALKNGKLCEKYTGSDEKRLEAFVKDWA